MSRDVDVLELAGSLAYLDEMSARFHEAPGEVDASWGEVLGNGTANGSAPSPSPTTSASALKGLNGNGHGRVGQSAPPGMPSFARPGVVTLSPLAAAAQPSVYPIVDAYRRLGHFAAQLDPLGLIETGDVGELEPGTWGITAADMSRVVSPTGVHGLPRATIGELLERLRRTYSGSVGLEFMHISSPQRRTWLAQRMETQAAALDPKVRTRMLSLLINAEQFERFCHTKFPGTKRFSLEGSESLIPALDLALTHAARLGAIEAVIGMAHRGRLATIESIMKRPGRDLFAQFEDVEPEKAMGGGDVKYHLGYSSDRTDPNGNAMHLSLAFNPSHLEAVDPVVVGRVRAKQTRHGDPSTSASSASSCTATPRSPARASCPRSCSCRGSRAIAPAARCTSSSTTRSGSPRRRPSSARRRTAPTSPR